MRLFRRQTPQAIVDQLVAMTEGTRFQLLSPIVVQKKGEFQDLFASLQAQGYARAVVDGEQVILAEAKAAEEELQARHFSCRGQARREA